MTLSSTRRCARPENHFSQILRYLLANDSFPLKSFLIFAFLYFLEAKFKGLIQFLHPIVRKQSKGKNTNKAWKENKVFAEGCRNLKYLQPFRIRVKEKLCNRYRYEIFLRRYSRVDSISFSLLSVNQLFIGTKTFNKTNQTASRKSRYLLCTSEWNQFMLFNPHYDVVLYTKPKWISRSLMRV